MLKLGRYVRLSLASVALLGVAVAANATTYDLGTTSLPAALGNLIPTPTVTDGDILTLKGLWDGKGSTALASKTSWYFTSAIPGLFLSGAQISNNGFANFSAQLFDDSTNTLLHTFTAGVTAPLISLATAGLYRLDVIVDLLHGHANSYTFDAQVVPLPAAAWLLLSGVVGLGAMARRRKVTVES